MIVTYTKTGEDPRTWNFHPEDLSESMAEVIERRFGTDTPTFEAWQQGVHQGMARARRVLLWFLLWRDHPALRFEEVDPKRRELKVEFTVPELEAMRDRVRNSRKMNPDDRVKLLEALDIQMETAPQEPEPEGKAPSES